MTTTQTGTGRKPATRRSVLGWLAALAPTACAAPLRDPWEPPAPPPAPRPPAASAPPLPPPRPFAIARVGWVAPIAALGADWDCDARGGYPVGPAGAGLPARAELAAALARQAGNFGYRVAGDPLREERADVDEALSAGVIDARIAMCEAPPAYPGPYRGYPLSARATIQVRWELASRRERRVVFRSVTTGEADSYAPHGADTVMLVEAFAAAAGTLLRDPAFRRVLSRPPQPALA